MTGFMYWLDSFLIIMFIILFSIIFFTVDIEHVRFYILYSILVSLSNSDQYLY